MFDTADNLISIPEEKDAKTEFLQKCAEIYKPFKASAPVKELHTTREGCRLFLFPSGAYEPSNFFAPDEWLMADEADKRIDQAVHSKEFADYQLAIGCRSYKIETRKKHKVFYDLCGGKLTKSSCWGTKEYRLRLFIG